MGVELAFSFSWVSVGLPLIVVVFSTARTGGDLSLAQCFASGVRVAIARVCVARDAVDDG